MTVLEVAMRRIENSRRGAAGGRLSRIFAGWPVLLVCALTFGCVEDNNSDDDMGVDPQPTAEPEGQPEPQPEAQPEPQPEGQPEPQPEPQPEGQPEPQPEPQPEGQPEPQPEPQPEGQPEPQPEPEAQPEPEPEGQPEPQPEPEPEAPIDDCESACARVDGCFDEACGVEPPAGFQGLCEEVCAENPPLVTVVASADSCEDLAATLRAVSPDFGAICPERPEPVGCRAVCTRVVTECAMVPDPEGEIDACTRACEQQMPTPAQIECGLTAECQDIEACADLEPQPDPDAQCEAACRRALDCQPVPPGADPEMLLAQCIPQCIAETTPAERQCVIAAECDAIDQCEGAQGGDVEAECRAACGVVSECQDFPPDALPACVDGCVQESTPRERACVLENADQCDAIEACIAGEQPVPPGGDVDAECRSACGVLVRCEGVPPEQEGAALEQCQIACVQESTAEERACVNGLDDCGGLDMCLPN